MTPADPSWSWPPAGVESAEMRADGLSVYRYWIERRWSAAPGYLLWVLFNPSTATAGGEDDNAVKVCIQRTKRHARRRRDIGAIRIVNLFARRSTNVASDHEWPKGDGLDDDYWIGPGNDSHIAEQANGATLIVAGWGPDLLRYTNSHWRADEVEGMLRDPYCVAVNRAGIPMYAGRQTLPMDTPLVALSTARAVTENPASLAQRQPASSRQRASTATYYVKFGNEDRRRWDDALRYGFVSAGGARKWSTPLRQLQPGDEVLVHVPPGQYLGWGRVRQPAQPIRDVQVEVGRRMIPLLDAPLVSPAITNDPFDDERCEWVVRVDWVKAVPQGHGYWRTGLYTNRGTTVRQFPDDIQAQDIRAHL